MKELAQTLEVKVLSNDMIESEEFVYQNNTYSLDDAKKLFVDLEASLSSSSLIVRMPREASVDAGMEYKEKFQSVGFKSVRVGLVADGDSQ